MVKGADDPEEIAKPPSEAESTAAIRASSFPPELIAHMVRCWDAERENAERLTKKVNVIVSILALLFGLGLFKIEWTYDPNHLSRVPDARTVWIIKFCLVTSLLCFAGGLYLGISPTKRLSGEQGAFASDLLHFSDVIAAAPPSDDVEARAIIFYRLSEAIDELRSQNESKNGKVRNCGWFFMGGLALVFIAVSAYILCGIPPIEGSRDHGRSDPKSLKRSGTTTGAVSQGIGPTLYPEHANASEQQCQWLDQENSGGLSCNARRPVSSQQSDQFFQLPHVIGNSRLHCERPTRASVEA